MLPTLVDEHGRVAYGIRERPVDLVNALDFDLRSPCGRRRPAWRRRLAHKRFQYFGGIADDVVFGCALADMRWVGLVFVYVWLPRERRMLLERSFRLPLARGLTLTDSPTRGDSVFLRGTAHVRMEYRPTGKRLGVALGDALTIDARLTDAPPHRPLVICTPAGRTGWVYAQKTAGVAVTGRLRAGDLDFDLGRAGCFGHHDFSTGFMRRETVWNWACLSGRTTDGARLGLNLSCGVNETSWTENCLWIDDALVKVDLARFTFDRDDRRAPWRVESGDGRVRLDFTPAGEHRERLALGLVASDFHQLFGRFRGEIAGGGRTHGVDCLGFVEDQWTRW
jgi:hypothetical protein